MKTWVKKWKSESKNNCGNRNANKKIADIGEEANNNVERR